MSDDRRPLWERRPYVRRPRVGEWVEGRTGPERVVAVNRDGTRITTVDRLGRTAIAVRVPVGYYRRTAPMEVTP